MASSSPSLISTTTNTDDEEEGDDNDCNSSSHTATARDSVEARHRVPGVSSGSHAVLLPEQMAELGLTGRPWSRRRSGGVQQGPKAKVEEEAARHGGVFARELADNGGGAPKQPLPTGSHLDAPHWATSSPVLNPIRPNHSDCLDEFTKMPTRVHTAKQAKDVYPPDAPGVACVDASHGGGALPMSGQKQAGAVASETLVRKDVLAGLLCHRGKVAPQRPVSEKAGYQSANGWNGKRPLLPRASVSLATP
uniref:Uncharacterized protein n=1 Tax=Oryza punctata TaxID=4537 RepID=A0A0E0LRP8_ORYPU